MTLALAYTRRASSAQVVCRSITASAIFCIRSMQLECSCRSSIHSNNTAIIKTPNGYVSTSDYCQTVWTTRYIQTVMAPLEGDTFCAPQKNGIRGSILLGTITFYPFTAKVLLCCFAVVPLSAYLNDSCQRLTFDISFCNCTCPLFQIRYLVPGIRRILFEIS